MNQRIVSSLAGGSRVRFAITLVGLAVMFALGNQIINPSQARHALAAAAAVTGLIAGTIPLLGHHRLTLQRWLLVGSLAAVAAMLGVLTRMLLHGVMHRAG